MLSDKDILMNDDELAFLAKEMSLHNSIFYTIWAVSRIYFTEVIPTACICFDEKHHAVGIYLNLSFWNSLSIEGKHFVIMHECLHMFFDHGRRFNKNYSQKANNVAQDIVINETITTSMGIDRDLIGNWEQYCFIDTCFKGKHYVKRNQTFEYYLSMLPKRDKEMNEMNTVDDHEMNQLPDRMVDDILDQFKHNSSEQDINQMAEVFEKIMDITPENPLNKHVPKKGNIDGEKAGNTSDPVVNFLNELKKERLKSQKKTWLNLVKTLTPSKRKISYEKEEGWRTQKTQYSILDANIMIVGEAEKEVISKKKYDIVVYIDISGSCANLVNPFYELLYTFPEEDFNIRTFTFNTNTKEFDWKKVRPTSSGGTCFKCINDSVNIITKKQKHPDVVFVFTDGEGSAYTAQYPEKWVWILSKDYTHYIQNKSKTFQMKEFRIFCGKPR